MSGSMSACRLDDSTGGSQQATHSCRWSRWTRPRRTSRPASKSSTPSADV